MIVQEFGGVRANDMRYIRDLCFYLNSGDVDELIETLKVFFANVPDGISLKDEKYYQSLFYAIFTLVGFNIQAEIQTNRGRIDCVIETDDKVYVIEFKLSGSKEQAMAQINDKQYAQKYQKHDKTLTLLGIEFDNDTRNIGGFVCG